MSDISGTGAAAMLPRATNAGALAAFTLMAGTGGLNVVDASPFAATNLFVRTQPAVNMSAEPMAPAAATIQEQLTLIRSNFDFSIVELASALRVSRQTIYDWFAERQMPQLVSLARLRRLCDLSSRWREDMGDNFESVHRKFADKPRILEILSVEDLETERVGRELRLITSARSSVPPQVQSITELRKIHGFQSRSTTRQNESIEHAGR